MQTAVRNFVKAFLLVTIGLFSKGYAHAQSLHMDSLSHVNYQALHQANLNDCWGYTDETGIEYALVGTTKGTSIVSLADPSNPVEIFWEQGTESIWRDLQVYGDYAYITTEAEDGLLIIDLTPLPASNVLPTAYYTGPLGNEWQSAHDIFIDPVQGWGYICGANRGNGGIIILDLHTNPMSPIEVGEFDNWYCHDAFSQGNLLYGAHISDGLLSIIDVTDRSNPVLLNTKITPNAFTHNVWVTSNDQYAVTTDEVIDAFVTLYDVSDPMNIQELDRIQSNPAGIPIPHNSFIVNDTLIATSYYTEGIVVHDMRRPHNLVEIAFYDTHPSEAGVFDGSWGVYPFFESGIYLASDMTQGLFIIQSDFVGAAWFEGHVRDASNAQPLLNVSITIQGDPHTDLTDINGDFGVGTVVPGTQQVTISKPAYYPQTVNVNFQNNVLIIDTFDLVPIIPQPITLNVQDQNGNPIIGANVQLKHPELTIDDQTDGFGESVIQAYYQGSNQLIIGKWGYVTYCEELIITPSTTAITIQLQTGYYDDFTFDFGWNSNSVNATAGFWQRGVPFYNLTPATPQGDAVYDCGDQCFITGNAASYDANLDDVDEGIVRLNSPIFDLTAYADPYINYERFFFNFHGPNAFDDSMNVYLTNGTTTALIDFIGPSVYNSQWEAVSKRVLDFMPLSSNMQLLITVGDQPANGNITDGAFDRFSVTNTPLASISETSAESGIVYPNPTSGKVIFPVVDPSEFMVLDPNGTVCMRGIVTKESAEIDLSSLQSGLYFIRMGEATYRVLKL
ncbi:MAG: choice-of-anchor B family protein [Fluviicola sp.]|jgi:choice-of-anchor B domain-containing protein